MGSSALDYAFGLLPMYWDEPCELQMRDHLPALKMAGNTFPSQEAVSVNIYKNFIP